MAARAAASGTVLCNRAQVETIGLAPGRYTASAVALLDHQRVGRVSQTFQVVAPGVQ
jgi:hypothetical protein